MKKTMIVVAAMVMVASMAMVSSAEAATKLLPRGTTVSASVNADGTADIAVAGVAVDRIEVYAYEGIREVSSSQTKIDLREGRRFQVVVGGYYALLTPDMAGKPVPDFFGSGVGLDCSNPGGCSFIVTGK